MNWSDLSPVIALALLGGSAFLLLGMAILGRKATPVFREIPAFFRLRKAVGRAVEDGSRLHVSLGRGSLATPQGAAGLAGLSALRRLADLTSTSDLPRSPLPATAAWRSFPRMSCRLPSRMQPEARILMPLVVALPV